MWQSFSNSNFCKRWKVVLSVIFSPGFFLSALVTGIALYLSIYYKNNIPFSNTMAIVGSLFGGIAGAFIKDEYDYWAGKNILEKKGRSALRNLQAIGTQLVNIKDWVVEFSKKAPKAEDRRTLEEINRHIATIELNIASGLEDWVDIVPELKEKTQKEAELDKKYKDLLQSYFNELVEKRKELITSTDHKKEQELKSKISDLETQIKEIRKERPRAVWGGGTALNNGIVRFHSGTGVAVAGGTGSTIGSKTCPSCGRLHNGKGTTVGDLFCDDCRGADPRAL